MTKKRWIAVACMLACFLCAGLFARALLTTPNPVVTPGVTKLNCDRIQKGMTKAEVEAILGGAPGDHSAERHFDMSRANIINHKKDALELWAADKGLAAIWFDQSGIVTGAEFCKWQSCVIEEEDNSSFTIFIDWVRRLVRL